VLPANKSCATKQNCKRRKAGGNNILIPRNILFGRLTCYRTELDCSMGKLTARTVTVVDGGDVILAIAGDALADQRACNQPESSH
jgi:hypothetical protein